MKTFYIMYVKGCPLGSWKINRHGSYFRFRRWYSHPRALTMAKRMNEYYGNEVIIQACNGNDVTENVVLQSKGVSV